MSKHPDQPIYKDEDGKYRFQSNAIILWMRSHFDMNKIVQLLNSRPGCTQEDLDQFYQLIGYSVGGYCELAGSDVISHEAADRAEAIVKQLKEKES